jgi:hypothetical protein
MSIDSQNNQYDFPLEEKKWQLLYSLTYILTYTLHAFIISNWAASWSKSASAMPVVNDRVTSH